MEHVARQYSIQGRHKRIYRMYSESKILKFTLDLGFTGIANIVNFNIIELIFIYLFSQNVFIVYFTNFIVY